MKMNVRPASAIAFVLFFLVFPSGCLKDHLKYTYTFQIPIYESLAQVRAGTGVKAPAGLESISKIYVQGKYIFLTETEKGIHVIDNSDPMNPRNISFISIAGNQEMAIQGHTLYADSYSDLLAIDISDPGHIVIRKTLGNIFLDRLTYSTEYGNPDSTFVIVGWKTRDTTVDYPGNPGIWYGIYPPCANCVYMRAAVPAASSQPQGVGGSMARFTVVNDWLYAVDNPNLNVINITQREDPQLVKQFMVDYHIETIYPFQDKLFIGSNNGVFMYDISATPGDPRPAGQFTHVRACDPVIADEKYAYVTLSDGTPCLGFANELQVVNIENLDAPVLVRTYPMTHPLGLAKDGKNLFLCDQRDGLKVYDAGDPANLRMVAHFTDATTMDVIALDGLALVLANEGLFEYDYSDSSQVRRLGKLLFSKN